MTTFNPNNENKTKSDFTAGHKIFETNYVSCEKALKGKSLISVFQEFFCYHKQNFQFGGRTEH